jgi:hypothetical protein
MAGSLKAFAALTAIHAAMKADLFRAEKYLRQKEA